MNKVNEANRIMYSFCVASNWSFIDYNSINETCLNTRGLHLNRKGNSMVAKNISFYIKSNEEIATGKSVFSPLICSPLSLSKSTHSNIFKRGLAMACLNINSLISHMDDYRIFMYDTNIDVLAINETKLDTSILNNEVHLDGYEIIRKDRYTNGRNGGGVVSMWVTI